MSKAYLADSLRSYYNRPFTTAEIASSSYRASAKKLTTKTRLVHPLVVGYVGVTLALWGLLHILLPLRLDGLIDTSYKALFAPIWIWITITHIIIWWFVGHMAVVEHSEKVAPEGPPPLSSAFARTYALFLNPGILVVGVAVFLLALKWDYQIFISSGIIVSPIFMFGGASFVLSCVYVRNNMRFKFAFSSTILYFTVGLVIISSKADFIIPWGWTVSSVVFFWIPDAAFVVVLFGFAWVDYHASLYDHLRHRVTTFVWHAAVTATFVAIVRCFLPLRLFLNPDVASIPRAQVIWQWMICQKADGLVDLPWVDIFIPGWLGNGAALVLYILSVVHRVRYDTQNSQYILSENLKIIRGQMHTILDAQFRLYMNKFPNLADDMKRLLESGMHSDMEIVVEERIFKVHRIVLYLRRHLWDIEQDLATGRIAADVAGNRYTLKNSSITSLEMLNSLLYIYTGIDEYADGFMFVKKARLEHQVSWNYFDRSRLHRDMIVAVEKQNSKSVKKRCDISFMVKDNGRKIQLNASKAILATRSLYFDGMFHGGFQETASKSLPLPSDVQEKYFRQLLKFVYTGKTPIWNIDTSRPSLPSSSSDTFDNILQFLQVAHRYQVPHALRKIQLTIMTHFITRDTIGDILRIADEYELNDLREFCFLWLVIEWDAFLEDLCIDKLPDALRDRAYQMHGQLDESFSKCIHNTFPIPSDNSAIIYYIDESELGHRISNSRD